MIEKFVLTNDDNQLTATLAFQVNGVEFVLFLFAAPETLRSGKESQEVWKVEYISLRRIDKTPFNAYEFVEPLTMAARPAVLVPAVSHAMCFLFCSVMFTVDMPQIVQEKYQLNAQQLGLQFLGLIIGTVLGEQLGGILSDMWMKVRQSRTSKKPDPEYRLWLSYIGFVPVLAGIVMYLVCAQVSTRSILPVIGTAIAGFGNQVVTTVLVTYAVDCYPRKSASVGVFIGFVRQTWGFIGPFW